MKRCWLHIGMPKTGSSSIQQNLAAISKTPGLDWLILRVGGAPNMGSVLYAMFEQNVLKLHKFRKSGASEAEVAEQGRRWKSTLQRKIEEHGDKTFIISAESLSDSFGRIGIERLRDFLASFFDEIKVTGYVRSPMAYKISRYQENLKYGLSSFTPDRVPLNYKVRFKKFDDLFGAENVILRKFDPTTFSEGCIVKDFCAQTGITLPPGAEIKRVNDGLSREGCAMLYAYRKFGPPFGEGPSSLIENRAVIRPLRALGGSKFKVHPSLFTESLEMERAAIQWMEKRLGVSLDEAPESGDGFITCEEDMLNIRSDSCREYADNFRELYGARIPKRWLPKGEAADPVEVARFLDQCRGICARDIRSRQAGKTSSWMRLRGETHRYVRSLWSRFPL